MVRHFVQQPLPSSFMIISIAGFVFSALVVWPIDLTWGFTLTFTFALWFIAAVYNFTHALGDEHLDIHNSQALARQSKVLPKVKAQHSALMSRTLAVVLAFVGGGLSMIFTHGKHEKGLLIGYLTLLAAAVVGRFVILRPGGADFYALMVMILAATHIGFMLFQALRSDVAFSP